MSADNDPFAFAEYAPASPYIETIWRSQSVHAGDFLSVAAAHWEMVITELDGTIQLTVRGPESQSTVAHCPANGEWLGIIFKLGAYMPHLPTIKLVDHEVNLANAGERTFWLHGSAWQYPTYENVETFVAKLVREGILVYEPAVTAALQNQATDLSLRSVQRRFLHATGLTQGQVSQIERARWAVTLLKQGVPILDVVEQVGYADQPHLTRSLKRFIGQTPTQLMAPLEQQGMSFLSLTGLVE